MRTHTYRERERDGARKISSSCFHSQYSIPEYQGIETRYLNANDARRITSESTGIFVRIGAAKGCDTPRIDAAKRRDTLRIGAAKGCDTPLGEK
jgi:hypothetical protein